MCITVVVISTRFYLKADEIQVQPSDITSISTLLDRGLKFLEYFLGSLAFIGVAISGIQFGMAGGNPEKAAKAKKALLYSCIGIALSVLSFAITKSVFGLLN